MRFCLTWLDFIMHNDYFSLVFCVAIRIISRKYYYALRIIFAYVGGSMNNQTINTYTLLDVAKLFNKKSKLTIKSMAEKKCPDELQMIDGKFYITQTGLEILAREYDVLLPGNNVSDPVRDNELQELKLENTKLREQLENANNNVAQAWEYLNQIKALQSPKDEKLHALELTSYKYKLLAIISIILFVIVLGVLIAFIFTR